MSTVLESWTEPAERTAEHDALRVYVPAGVSVGDYWLVNVVATEDVNGEPLGVAVSRRARVSSVSHRALGVRPGSG